MVIDYSQRRSFEITITPEMAQEWLNRNFNNRRIQDHRVSVIANDIKNGKWAITGDTIKLSKNGELIDGQHRLAAIVKAGISVSAFVATGIERTPFIDNNKVRTPGEQMLIAGWAEKGDIYLDNHCLAVANFLKRYSIYQGTTSWHFETKASTEELFLWMNSHKEPLEFIHSLSKVHCGSVNARSAFILAAIFVCYVNGISEKNLKDWYRVIRTGEYEGEKQLSALAFRNALIASKNTHKEKEELFLKAQHSIQCFNVRKLKTLKTDLAFPFEWRVNP